MKIWCPYIGSYIEQVDSTPEHIIPLALGGSNLFVVPVERNINSKLGSEIDGKYGEDFLVKIRRNRNGAKGHSGKKAVPIVKKGFDEKNNPIQVNLDIENENIQLYDPKERISRDGQGGESISMSIKMDSEIYLQLTSKISLAAGYFAYGDWFIDNVAHDELRILLTKQSQIDKKKLASLKTTIFTFLTGGLSQKDQVELDQQRLACQSVSGGLVLFNHYQDRIGITVGILGEYVGTVYVPAKTVNIPNSQSNFDLGHAIIIEKDGIQRMSGRAFFIRLLGKLNICKKRKATGGKMFVERISRMLERFEAKDINFDDFAALYLLANLRQLIEVDNIKSQYQVIDFYACWALHASLNRNTVSQDILNILGTALPVKEVDSAFIDEVCKSIGESYLRDQIEHLFQAYKMRDVITKPDTWKNIYGTILNLLLLKPLEPPLKAKRGMNLKLTIGDYPYVNEDSSLRLWLEGDRGSQAIWKIAVVPDSVKFDLEDLSKVHVFEGGLFFKG
jgi:hypothetical protein